MSSLYTTGVPVPFECALAMKVKDPMSVERALHIAFAPSRVNPGGSSSELIRNSR